MKCDKVDRTCIVDIHKRACYRVDDQHEVICAQYGYLENEIRSLLRSYQNLFRGKKETPQQFLFRKLEIFGKYLQKEPLQCQYRPEACQICGDVTREYKPFARFSHKERVFEILACHECMELAGIKVI